MGSTLFSNSTCAGSGSSAPLHSFRFGLWSRHDLGASRCSLLTPLSNGTVCHCHISCPTSTCVNAAAAGVPTSSPLSSALASSISSSVSRLHPPLTHINWYANVRLMPQPRIHCHHPLPPFANYAPPTPRASGALLPLFIINLIT